VIDLHTHVLPGIDDGPPNLDGSLELARVAAAAGTTTIVATPHITWELPNTGESVAAAVEALQAELDAAGIPVTLRTGGELVISRAAELPEDDLRALHLGGGEWLLAECPLSPAGVGFENLLYTLRARGHKIVLAHPERSPVLQRNIDLVRSLCDAGMLSSITAGSLQGRFGTTVKRFAYELLEEGLVHNIASDAHDARRRAPGMGEAIDDAERELPGVAALGQWMTVDVPRAILDGGTIPAAPADPPRRRRRGFLRRAARSR
jgi:protein-tyrosine phosphatase